MANKRDSAGAHISARGKELLTRRRPSSRGNALALEDHDDPMTDEHQQMDARSAPKTSSSVDGGESDASSDPANRARKKAEPVKSACVQCQKRKTKCSGQRPVCRFCSDRNLECSWDIGDGLTRTADLKQKLVDATGRFDNLDTLVDAMRDGSDEVSTMLLARLRLGTSVGDLAMGIRLDAASAEQHVRNSSTEDSSQTSESRERQYSSSGTGDVSSPAAYKHPFDWPTGSAQIHKEGQPNESWTMDALHYQATSPQSFLTSEFDQSRMTWRMANPFYSPGEAQSQNEQQQREQQQQYQQQQQQQQQQEQQRQQSHQHQQPQQNNPQASHRRSSVGAIPSDHRDTRSRQRGIKTDPAPASDTFLR
ncbi:hypothetical protein Q7P37_001057 [Cladosporium fusiforme]